MNKKIAVFQMDIAGGDPGANREKVRRWLEETMREDAPDIAVLPEMWTTAYALPELEDCADRALEPTLSFLQKEASRHSVNIIGGSVANKKDGAIYNTAVVINRRGELIYQYDKLHLVPMLDEPSYLTGGALPVAAFELDGIKMGVIICYDLRFPELTRRLAVAGAEIIFLPAEWPAARRDHWRVLQQARAIENQVFMVSANRVGTYDGTEFAGTSMITDPWGTVISDGSTDKEETIVMTLDLSKVEEVRSKVPVLKGRLPDLY